MCDCLNQIQEKLKEHNTEVAVSFSLSGGPTRPLLAVERIDPKKRVGPINIIPAHCPFCGEAYEEKKEPPQ